MNLFEKVKAEFLKSPITASGVIIGLLFSLFSFCTSLQANSYSAEANRISNSANGIAQAALQKNQEEMSDSIATGAYDSIYRNESNRQIMQGFVANRDAQLDSFIDIFEYAGSKYCEGAVYRKHIKDNLQQSLNVICNQKDLVRMYGNDKNGVAILCHYFDKGSLFDAHLVKGSLDKCKINEL